MRPSVSVADRHRAWLQLVDTDGPFLAVPPLKRVWSTGMPQLNGDRLEALRGAKPEFEKAYDELSVGDPQSDPAAALAAYRPVRDTWVQTLLREVVGWNDLLRLEADDGGATDLALGAVLDGARITSDNGTVRRRPSGALLHGETVGALVWVIDPVEHLRQIFDDGWAHSPIDAMTDMLRASHAPIGLVTDGRWWGLVSAPRPDTPTAAKAAAGQTPILPASGIVDALTFVEEGGVRDALAQLLDPIRLVAGRPEDRLTALFVESVAAAEEITVSLGVQVRRAVELLVQAFSESADQARRQGLPDPLPVKEDGSADEVYQAAVTVMMRIVFLLFAQERQLLPDSHVFTGAYGLVGVIDDLDARARDEGAEALDATRLTWHRLLATSAALHRGASFDDARLPGYGGSLFDPHRFGLLGATIPSGALAVTVSDLVMRHVLQAVQVAVVKGEARRVSFREIDVEQIGYIYEQLLGYTAHRVDDIRIGLIGPIGNEVEIPLDVLDDLAEEHVSDAKIATAIAAWAKEHQPSSKLPSKAAVTKALRAGDVPADQTERLLRAVTPDVSIRERLAPWIGVIRGDLRDRPTVFLPGGLVVVETPSRRSAGAHYTPRVLAEEVVEHALAPLVYRPGPHETGDRLAWRLKDSTEITDLKVADIACGSGAFLVAAARYLARRLIEAWEFQGGFGVSGRSAGQLELDATREIVARCLYGADINPMAVEMCKLSLWLVSLDPKLPFSFVDDKLFCGNSLLGLTDLRQLKELHLYPQDRPAQFSMSLTLDNRLVARLDVPSVLHRAKRLREQLSSKVDDTDPQRSARAKEHQLAQLREVTSTLRKVADGVIAAGLPLGGKPGKALNQAYDGLLRAVGAAYPAADREEDSSPLDQLIADGLTPTVPTDYARWQPLHWVIEVPDVMERGGFDAIVGNPPFLGGKKISGASGTDMREWLVNAIAGSVKGNADLVAYFFLRAMSLLNRAGTLGLIATNTVGQGDTREVGLDQMVGDGFTITRAIQSRSWPAASANLEYAAVWGGVGQVAKGAPRVSDGVTVRRISTLLEPAGRVEGHPVRLAENAGIAFIGCYVLGMGFVIDEEQARAWITEDPRNADVIFPYLNGEDLNSRPDSSASRWVIDFNARPEHEASTYAEPFRRVRELVLPERQKVNRQTHRDRWWIYADKRPALRRAIRDLAEVLVIALVSKTVMPLRVSTSQVFSHALGVFALADWTAQTVLSSSFHQTWAIKYGSGMRNDPRYTPSDVFETFPRLQPTERLEAIGRVLDEERREIMLQRQLGLTKFYNLVNDPDIQGDPDVDRMRDIHVEVDEAVLAAYGWDDVPLHHGFHTYRQMRRWTICPEARVEILDRLLEENHCRAAAQGDVPPPAEADDGGNDNVDERDDE